MSQTQRNKDKAEETEVDQTEVPEPKEFDIDSILDEIDGVLEENAQEFVDGYIQKGGQ